MFDKKPAIAYYRTDDAFGSGLTALYATVGPERTLTPNGEPLEHGIRGYTAAMYVVAQNTITNGVLSADFARRFCRPLDANSAYKLSPELVAYVNANRDEIFKAA